MQRLTESSIEVLKKLYEICRQYDIANPTDGVTDELYLIIYNEHASYKKMQKIFNGIRVPNKISDTYKKGRKNHPLTIFTREINKEFQDELTMARQEYKKGRVDWYALCACIMMREIEGRIHELKIKEAEAKPITDEKINEVIIGE